MNLRLYVLAFVALAGFPGILRAQVEGVVGSGEQVQFRSADGLTLYGDLYRAEAGEAGPIIVLFHQAGSNARGEYHEIVPTLVANGYSALAVDLRTGGSRYGSENRTVANGDLAESQEYCAVYPDLLAAWQYVIDQGFRGPRFAWGSSFSGALVLRLAVERAHEMRAVLAFSPAGGEPMEGCQPDTYLGDLSVPALILRPETEAAMERVASQLQRFEAVNRPGFSGDRFT
jgi:dienelactone hydrolase